MPKADQIETSRMEQQPALRGTNPNQLGDDTIDLYKLWLTLWKRKWLIILITVVSALGSKLYSMQLPHIYRAEALILAPKEKDLTLLNLHKSLLDTEINETAKIITKINSEKIFSKFKNNLKSRRMIKRFIQQYGLMEDLAPNRTAATRNEDIYQGFANLITLKTENGMTSLSIELEDKEKAAIWINDFIGFVDKQTISFLVENIQNSIENRIVVIEHNINSKRLMAEKRREDQIVRYSEHAQIAKQI